MHNDNKKLTAYLVLTGVLASQFVVNESVASAQGFLTNSEILLNKEGANSNETTNNLDYNAVEKVDLSKELEKDENTETEQRLTYEDIDESSSIRAPKEELDSKELAKRLVISSFSFASVGAATGIINHLVDSKNEQQNKKEDDPIPGPNQENNTIPRTNQEDNTIPRTNQENDPGNNFLKIVIYTVLLWLFVKFVFVLRVHSEKGLFWLNLLTKLKLRPKKVKFIIEIDENDNPPDFIIEAAQKNLISPGDEVIIPESKKDLERECANKILDNCDDIIFFVDPEAIVDPDSKTAEMKYTGVLNVVSVSGLFKYYIDIAEKSNINSLDDLKDFSKKVSDFFTINLFRGKKAIPNKKNILAIRTAIDIIIHPSAGDLINSSWTRNNNKEFEDALNFLEKEKINNDYIKSRIDATKLYRSILLGAGFGFGENNKVLKPNGKGTPGSIEIFQMLLCMEKLLEDNLEESDLPAYNSLLIEFYYYSILNPEHIKDKFDENDTEWEKEVFRKLKEFESKQKTVNKKVLLEKIKELKEFLQKVNSAIKADELKKKVYADELNNKVDESILQNNNQWH